MATVFEYTTPLSACVLKGTSGTGKNATRISVKVTAEESGSGLTWKAQVVDADHFYYRKATAGSGNYTPDSYKGQTVTVGGTTYYYSHTFTDTDTGTTRYMYYAQTSYVSSGDGKIYFQLIVDENKSDAVVGCKAVASGNTGGTGWNKIGSTGNSAEMASTAPYTDHTVQLYIYDDWANIGSVTLTINTATTSGGGGSGSGGASGGNGRIYAKVNGNWRMIV